MDDILAQAPEAASMLKLSRSRFGQCLDGKPPAALRSISGCMTVITFQKDPTQCLKEQGGQVVTNFD